jgi:porphobilinogen synthase
MSFPVHRPRRLRANEAWRRAVRETDLDPSRLILPLFVVPGEGTCDPVVSMPGVEQRSVDRTVELAAEAAAAGVGGVILFGIPAHKDAKGSSGWDPEGPVPSALRALRDEVPELLRWADVCLCEYTDHGHCGLLTPDGRVDNDATLPLLSRAALAYADAGAHAVAPSDMMDGRVGRIRTDLDSQGHEDVVVVSYAVKYASAFYGPFRDAAHSAPSFGDRRAYQMDPPNAREALREAWLDEEEGADILLVKPAGPYLDVIRAVREQTPLPMAAYQVSGEYAAVMAAAERGWLDEERVALESLLAIRRAGADMIITYWALKAARWLENG